MLAKHDEGTAVDGIAQSRPQILETVVVGQRARWSCFSSSQVVVQLPNINTLFTIYKKRPALHVVPFPTTTTPTPAAHSIPSVGAAFSIPSMRRHATTTL